MKNINKLIFTFCTLMIVSACVDEDKLFELDDFPTGAIPNMGRTANDDGFVNLLDLDNVNLEMTIGFTNDLEQSEDGGLTNGGSGRLSNDLEFSPVASISVEVLYTNAITGDVEHGVVGEFTTFPATVTLTVADLINVIPSLTSNADFNLGDQFNFISGLVMEDGRVLPAVIRDVPEEEGEEGALIPNYSVNFSGTLNNPGILYNLNYVVSCPSTIPEGVYDAVSGGTSTDGCPPTNPIVGLNYVVTITDLGGGTYSVSDYSAGVYQDWYGACYGYTFETSAVLVDICNNISFSLNDAFSCANTGTGTYDPGTGVIQYSWSNCFGDTGDVVLTPQ